VGDLLLDLNSKYTSLAKNKSGIGRGSDLDHISNALSRAGLEPATHWLNLVALEVLLHPTLVPHLQTPFYILGQFAAHTADNRGYCIKFGGLNRCAVNSVRAVHSSAEVNLNSLIADP
jgi:hypothetical protein